MRIRKMILLIIEYMKKYRNSNKIHCDNNINNKIYTQRIRRIDY